VRRSARSSSPSTARCPHCSSRRASRIAAVEGYAAKMLVSGDLLGGDKNDTASPKTKDSLQETLPGGHHQSNICRA
jgi:hypothetical protein